MDDVHTALQMQALLAERVRKGDQTAERELVAWLEPRLRLIASNKVPPRFIEDITQESLCGVVEALRGGRVHNESHLASFALGVLRNVISNYLRAEKGRATREEKAASESPAVETQTPLDLLIEREERRRVAACLGLLREEDREILFLSFYLALPPREVADRLGIQPNVARQRKWRAIQRFTEAYRGASTNGGPPRGVGS